MKIDYTVEDLVKILKEFPKSTPVLVDGYEEGYDNMNKPTLKKVKHDPDRSDWEGEFDKAEIHDDSFDALILRR